jgi:hypothetical protein
MTRDEALASIDETAISLAKACGMLGVVCAFMRSLDGGDERNVRLIGPDTLLVRPMLEACVAELKHREESHRC